MGKNKNRIAAGIILGFLILMSAVPAMAEDITLRDDYTYYKAGSLTQVLWTYNGSFQPNVSIELLKEGTLLGIITPDTYIGDIIWTGIGEGHYRYWNISVSLAPGIYQLKITGHNTSGLEVTDTNDIEITAPTEEGCRACHGGQATVSDPHPAAIIHHRMVSEGRTPLGCPDCHPAVNQPPVVTDFYIESNCLNCHNGTAFWANPVVDPGPPHFNPIPVPPVINSVTLSTNTPNTGDNILVTVNATDDVSVTSVVANGVSLTKQSNDIWNGSITAIEGTHSVNVSANDDAGYVTWDNSTSYTVITPNIIVTSPMTGDNWIRGTTQTIRWTYTGNLGDYAKIELLEQGRVDETWDNVPQANGVGSYDWTIPSNFEASTYQIRVSAGDYSNTSGNFNIVKR